MNKPINLVKLMAIASLLFLAKVQAEPINYYFENNENYNKDIPTPESVLGFNVGDRHVRHDQLVNYFTELAAKSEQVTLSKIGQTNEYRSQVLATISSKENLQNLDQILANRRATGKQDKNAPAVVWLGYSIHGNEISGSNASLLVAYHLAASSSKEVSDLLANLIIVIEPSMNPDGMDRYSTWINGNRTKTLNTDPEHREHYEPWPSGRTNHYMFDLNRDWLPLTQIESRNRVAQFHYYKPNVLADFHEMGKDSSYFFQPGVPDRTNPLTPNKVTELTNTFANYHRNALDSQNRLYYSEENFDDFYYGKGSTYPDINGGFGILFEQSSSEGSAIETSNGVRSFSYSVKNHVTSSFSTLNAAKDNKQKLHAYRNEFYQQIDDLADDDDFDGYIIQEQFDKTRLNNFLMLLNRHEISAYPLTQAYQGDYEDYLPQASYFIPLKQNQYRLIKTIFEQVTEFKDETFYDVSGWTLPLAYNIHSVRIETSKSIRFSKSPWQPVAKELSIPTQQSYAYAFHWQDFNAPAALNQLLSANINAKVATKEFTAKIGEKIETFGTGSIVINKGEQQNPDWFKVLTDVAAKYSIDLHALSTGHNQNGVDLGSPSLRVVKPIKVLMLAGVGVSQYEAGDMLYYLDNMQDIPVTVVEVDRIGNVDLNNYSHIIMVDGQYRTMTDSNIKKIESWLKNGGTIYAQKRGARLLSDKNVVNTEFVSKKGIDRLFSVRNLNYGDKQDLAAKKRLSGAIFASKLDTSHPLSYGYSDSDLALFKNSTLIIEQPSTPFITVSQFKPEALLSGYASMQLADKVSDSAAIVAHNVGKGRVILSSENLVFRGYWHGSAKIVANALFFSKAFSASSD